MQIFGLGRDVKKSGDDLALGGVVLEEAHRSEPVMDIVIGVELAQRERRAVVLLHEFDAARLIIDLDRRRGR